MSDNLLSPIDFAFTIKRLEQVNYFVQKVSLPGFSIQNVEQPNRYGGRIFLHGDKLDHDEFSISFKIDEEMENWFEIYSWLISLTAPESGSQYGVGGNPGLYSDASLIIMNSRKNPAHQFTFTNMAPKSISNVDFDTTVSGAIPYATATATFQFDLMNYKRIKTGT